MEKDTNPRLDCYVINLDRCPDRWKSVEAEFSPLELNLIRVSAYDGLTLSLPDKRFSPFWFYLNDGQEATNGQIACYFSHLDAMQMFLDSGREYALICEDDVSPLPGLVEAINEALKYRKTWDFLRIADVRLRSAFPYVRLTDSFSLATNITGISKTGGYLVTRKAVKRFLRKLVPMKNPYDVALFQGWFGIQEAALYPSGLVGNAHCEQTTIDINRRRTKNILNPIFWTCRFNRLSTRFWRYFLQLIRLLRRKISF